MAKKTGVYPVYENQFQVNTGAAAKAGTDGKSVTGGTFVQIAEMKVSTCRLIMVSRNGNLLIKRDGQGD